MQGGIRRKRDLLPRYKNGGSNKRRTTLLTTPMKKILIYCSVLLTFFLLFRYAYSDINKEREYELDHTGSSTDQQLHAVAEIAAADSSQDQFKNDVAKQQPVAKQHEAAGIPPVEQLEKGNIQTDSGVSKQQDAKDLENTHGLNYPEVELPKKGSAQSNSGFAKQQEIKGVGDQYKANDIVGASTTEQLKNGDTRINNGVAKQQEIQNLDAVYQPNEAAHVPAAEQFTNGVTQYNNKVAEEQPRRGGDQLSNGIASQQEAKGLENAHSLKNAAAGIPAAAAEQPEKGNIQYDDGFARQPEVKNLDSEYKANDAAGLATKGQLKKGGSHFNNGIGKQQGAENLQKGYSSDGVVGDAVGDAIGDAVQGVPAKAGQKKPEKSIKSPGQGTEKQIPQAGVPAGGHGGAKFPMD